ncbi:hypothetical protein NDI47_04605 [Microcoleus vaginatus GB1-A2]|uniref:hypothetical protein n=1 Tax=Microcoleus vaginatus TaxID=119532 RepID=UPI001683857C|nr:hypothetical protein [Microcoleus sp. FACHB-61]
MSSFKRFPTSVRYLIARLRHWSQPAVWAPLAVLCAGGLFIWEVSVNPERLRIDGEEEAASNNPASLPGLSAEDSAIAAEIDSLPVLANQFNRSNSEFGLLNSSVVKSQGLFEEIRARGLRITQPSSAPNQVASSRFLPLPNVANPAVGAANNNPQNSSLPSSNATSALSLSGSGGSISGIKTIGESGGTATATLSQPSSGTNSGQQNENSLPLSPLQAAMKKYVVATTSATAAAAQKTADSATLLDRPASAPAATNANAANLLPTTATAQAGANPVNIPAALPPLATPTNTATKESQEFLNPTATVPESFPGLNSRVPSLPEINAGAATVALPKNPYQTNLSGSGFAPEVQPAALPVATPSLTPLLPNVGQSPFPSAIGGSKIISPEFSPNSANSEFQPSQPSQLNLPPNQPNFGVVPQNANQGQQPQPFQPQPLSTPRSLAPGRYIGGGEINTFANP